jgi:hypothetical protein
MSNAPNLEYRRHHAVEPPRVDGRFFRPGWLRRTHLSILFERDRISLEAFQAGRAWRLWCETVGRELTQSWTARINRTPQPGAPTERQLGAARSLEAASQVLGRRRTALLMACCVDDMTWCAIGNQLKVDRRLVSGKVCEALEALAMWRDGKPVPKPPRRFRNQLSNWQ